MYPEIKLIPIGVVHSTRTDVVDDDWDKEAAYIELDAQFSEEALDGLTEFSHVEVIYYMDQVDPTKIETAARHPRNNKTWPKVGIFAQRAKNRPNQLGTTFCRVLRIEGRKLYVAGLDAVDGSPVLDIKPWVAEFAPRGKLMQPDWITELMKGYWTS